MSLATNVGASNPDQAFTPVRGHASRRPESLLARISLIDLPYMSLNGAKPKWAMSALAIANEGISEIASTGQKRRF